MPTIHAKVIVSRVARPCDWYRHPGGVMPAGTPQMRIYGSGFEYDPKYAMYCCLDCVKSSRDDRVIKAM